MRNQVQPSVQLTIIDGKEVINFTPNTVAPTAIVAISVLQRLAQALTATDVDYIKRKMAVQLNSAPGIDSVDDYINFLQGEIDFHTTVAALMQYQPEEEPASIADRQML